MNIPDVALLVILRLAPLIVFPNENVHFSILLKYMLKEYTSILNINK